MRSFLVIVLLVTSLPRVAASKSKPRASAPKKERARDVQFLKSPFDDTVRELPPNFVGNFFPDVYLRHSVEPKGEYETSAQFEARKTAIPTTTYAFPLQDATPRYDADKGVFSFSVRYDYSRDFRGLYSDAPLVMSVMHTETDRRKTAATNGIGVTMPIESVTDLTDQEFQVAATSLRYPGSIDFAVEVPPAEAPQLKSRLTVLLVCRTRPEPATIRSEFRDGSSGYHHVNATLDSATEYATSYFTLGTDIVGFWVYDMLTGRILQKFDGFGKTTKIQLLSD